MTAWPCPGPDPAVYRFSDFHLPRLGGLGRETLERDSCTSKREPSEDVPMRWFFEIEKIGARESPSRRAAGDHPLDVIELSRNAIQGHDRQVIPGMNHLTEATITRRLISDIESQYESNQLRFNSWTQQPLNRESRPDRWRSQRPPSSSAAARPARAPRLWTASHCPWYRRNCRPKTDSHRRR